ncbi:unnamed protein product [Polarella glacialis]|uniref:Uncharacterized protein n=1 Tax=Polarella glacialis TaxID=89957 RepID=A0A813JJN3_POLGL|nr:unnamed protein product [Polarella glacialis]
MSLMVMPQTMRSPGPSPRDVPLPMAFPGSPSMASSGAWGQVGGSMTVPAWASPRISLRPFSGDAPMSPIAAWRAPCSDDVSSPPFPQKSCQGGSSTPMAGSAVFWKNRPISTPHCLARRAAAATALRKDFAPGASPSPPAASPRHVRCEASPMRGQAHSYIPPLTAEAFVSPRMGMVPVPVHLAEPSAPSQFVPARLVSNGRPPTGGNAARGAPGIAFCSSPTRRVEEPQSPSSLPPKNSFQPVRGPALPPRQLWGDQPQQPLQQPRHQQYQDLVHQHVLFILRSNPQFTCRKVLQVCEGIYLVDGHEVNVEWQHSKRPGQRGQLVVVDGPMQQPFVDYLAMSEANVEYDTQPIARTSNLHHLAKERRITFDDKDKQYTRLEAMKVAKEQASLREKAADLVREGKQVPDDLVEKYNKLLSQKLRHPRSTEDEDLPTGVGQPQKQVAPAAPEVAKHAATTTPLVGQNPPLIQATLPATHMSAIAAGSAAGGHAVMASTNPQVISAFPALSMMTRSSSSSYSPPLVAAASSYQPPPIHAATTSYQPPPIHAATSSYQPPSLPAATSSYQPPCLPAATSSYQPPGLSSYQPPATPSVSRGRSCVEVVVQVEHLVQVPQLQLTAGSGWASARAPAAVPAASVVGVVAHPVTGMGVWPVAHRVHAPFSAASLQPSPSWQPPHSWQASFSSQPTLSWQPPVTRQQMPDDLLQQPMQQPWRQSHPLAEVRLAAVAQTDEFMSSPGGAMAQPSLTGFQWRP